MIDTKDNVTWPMVGSIWLHVKTGQHYMPLAYTNIEGTNARYPVTIIYRNVLTNMMYSRMLSDWERSFKLITRMQ